MKSATKSNYPSGELALPVRRMEYRDPELSDLKELLDFPANFLIKLPIYTNITIMARGDDREVIWSTAPRDELAAPESDAVFDRSELAALIAAAESERSRQSDLIEWIAAKREDPGVRIDLETAMAGAARVAEQGWSLERLLRWYGFELVAVELVRTYDDRDEALEAAA